MNPNNPLVEIDKLLNSLAVALDKQAEAIRDLEKVCVNAIAKLQALIEEQEGEAESLSADDDVFVQPKDAEEAEAIQENL